MQRIPLLAVACTIPLSAAAEPPAPPPSPAKPFTQTLTGTTATLEMVPVPGPSGEPLHISKAEITWDLYDIFVYKLDEPDDEPAPDASPPADAPPTPPADAVTRPSRPYIPPDRGYGHAGYPALSMTAHGAEQFCLWLSERTGHTYRLPTEA